MLFVMAWTLLASVRVLRIGADAVPLRATTRRVDDDWALRAAYVVPPVGVALRVVVADVPVFVALRAVRGTTRRSDDSFSVRVITLIGLLPWAGVTPGFKSVFI